MVAQEVIIPIAGLSGIVAVALAFIAWWFPRTWAKGNAEERRMMDEERAARETHLANLRAQQAPVHRPEEAETDGDTLPPPADQEAKPPEYVRVGTSKEYRPPVAGLG